MPEQVPNLECCHRRYDKLKNGILVCNASVVHGSQEGLALIGSIVCNLIAFLPYKNDKLL